MKTYQPYAPNQTYLLPSSPSELAAGRLDLIEDRAAMRALFATEHGRAAYALRKR